MCIALHAAGGRAHASLVRVDSCPTAGALQCRNILEWIDKETAKGSLVYVFTYLYMNFVVQRGEGGGREKGREGERMYGEREKGRRG